MLRNVFIAFVLVVFLTATGGIALYHCCCGLSVVEELHACCGSNKACDTHPHYAKLDIQFQQTNVVDCALDNLFIKINHTTSDALNSVQSGLSYISFLFIDKSPPWRHHQPEYIINRVLRL